MKFEIIEKPMKGLYIIEAKVFKDNRGFFMESWNKKEFEEMGLDFKFVQDNHSRSVKGVLRGLHFQRVRPQGKLVRVIRGRVYDVVVDLRRNSETFKKWYGIELTDDNGLMMYIPKGFAHGFLVLSDVADFFYKVTEFYLPKYDFGIRWDDPDISIEWPIDKVEKLIISEKDKNLPYLKDIISYLEW